MTIEVVAYPVLIVCGAITAVGMVYHYRATRCIGGLWATLYAINNMLIGVLAWVGHMRNGRDGLLWVLWPLVLFSVYTALQVFLLGWRHSR